MRNRALTSLTTLIVAAVIGPAQSQHGHAKGHDPHAKKSAACPVTKAKIAERDSDCRDKQDGGGPKRFHPEIGERICGPLRDADQVLPIIRHHQERWDGKGYPDGLKGEQIPLLARILSIADAYDAMLSPRPYRPALRHEEAEANLQAGSGRQWDPYLVELFLGGINRRSNRPTVIPVNDRQPALMC